MSQSPGNSCWKLEEEPSQNGDTGTGDNRSSLGLVRKSQNSTRVSLLVEALIRSMIAAYETDSRKVTQAYHRVCRRLFQMELIDESWSMAELEGARAQFEHILLQMLGAGPGRSATLPSFLPGGNSISQYKREFQEIKHIGEGGFGQVFRVRHKLDGTEYAVKKIPIHSKGINSVKNHLSEVKTFASMNHQNITQYKAAWLEIRLPNDAKPQWDKNKITVSPNKSENFIFHESISLTYNHTESNTESDSESNSNSSNDEIQSLDAARAVVLKEKVASVRRIHWATLYIQMSLCHGTLHQWLRHTKSFNPDNALTSIAVKAFKNKTIKEMLIQILKGLSYIHSKGVVHHDVKPSNIFVSFEDGSLLVQLGDFGLACPLQRVRHGFPRGTPLYAAPEQLAGRCDPKSDMYSVGIVLFELLEDFSTDMERIKRITELRSPTVPPVSQNLELNNLVLALVRHLPEERPDALTLLRSLEETTDVSTTQIDALQERLNEKDREIQRLTELLRKHGIQS